MPARFLHQVGVHLISCKMHTSRVMWYDDRKIPSRQFVIFWLTTALFSSQQVTSLIQAMSFVNFLVVLNLQLFCLTPIHQTSDNCRNSQFFRYTAIISLFIACTISLWSQIWGWEASKQWSPSPLQFVVIFFLPPPLLTLRVGQTSRETGDDTHVFLAMAC